MKLQYACNVSVSIQQIYFNPDLAKVDLRKYLWTANPEPLEMSCQSSDEGIQFYDIQSFL